MKPEERVEITFIKLIKENMSYTSQFYMRYIGDYTEMWFFGEGLGETCLMQQCGNSFLDMVNNGEDPHLGRIMVSCGLGTAIKHAYEGDWNLRWVYRCFDEWDENYVRPASKYHVHLCGSKAVQEKADGCGFKTFLMPFGSGRFFKPLGLKRSGVGYAGLDSKPKDQTNMVLNPFIGNPGFEWIMKTTNDNYLEPEQFNLWLNGKEVVLGMYTKVEEEYGVLSTRVFETLASGTPLIISRNRGTEETLGFKYPYETGSREETESIYRSIMGDYPKALENMAVFSEKVHREHSYEKRLRGLFKFLKEGK